MPLGRNGGNTYLARTISPPHPNRTPQAAKGVTGKGLQTNLSTLTNTRMETHHYLANPTRYACDGLYRRCGKSGVFLSAISLGWWKNFGSTRSYDKARAIALSAFDSGITHFDLANNYGPLPGTAETTLGHLLANELKPYRDELFISTKAGYEMWDGPYGNWGSRKSLFASIDQSLQRMGLDYVDLFYSHRYDPDTPLEETLQALVDIVRAGKALYVGISRWPLEATRFAHAYLAARDVRLLCYQGRIHLLDRAPMDEGILSFAEEAGIGFLSFSPLAQGLLTDRYLNGIPEDSRMHLETTLRQDALTDSRLRQLRQLQALARERGNTLAQMSLAWVLGQRGVTSVIVGASSPQQLADNLGAASTTPLTEVELARIEEILRTDTAQDT